MPQLKFKQKIDHLIKHACDIYQFLVISEQLLVAEILQELGQENREKNTFFVRKRRLRYFIQDKSQHDFQTLWLQYHFLFREIYRDFNIRTTSPSNDMLL